MQTLVTIFIALAALGIAATAYFGLIFTPVEAVLTGLVFFGLGVTLFEREQRRRAESRLERAIEELSRLLSTDAQAGAVLSQRVNHLSEENAGKRLETVEADVSVLGTVIRQVAEAVAELEEQRTPAAPVRERPAVPAPTAPAAAGPRIGLDEVRRAIDEDRLVVNVQPVVTLPQRRTYGYDLLPRLMLEAGELADPPDFMPRRGGEDVVRDIEAAALLEAITIGRRARNAGQPVNLFAPLSHATLSDPAALAQMAAAVGAKPSVLPSLGFRVPAEHWTALVKSEPGVVEQLRKREITIVLDAVASLRLDIAELAETGVRALRVEAGRFLSDPASFTDFHLSDIANYLARFGVDLMVVGVTAENQILELIEDGITLAQGPHIAPPGPVRADLVSDRPDSPALLRRAAS